MPRATPCSCRYTRYDLLDSQKKRIESGGRKSDDPFAPYPFDVDFIVCCIAHPKEQQQQQKQQQKPVAAQSSSESGSGSDDDDDDDDDSLVMPQWYCACCKHLVSRHGGNADYKCDGGETFVHGSKKTKNSHNQQKKQNNSNSSVLPPQQQQLLQQVEEMAQSPASYISGMGGFAAFGIGGTGSSSSSAAAAASSASSSLPPQKQQQPTSNSNSNNTSGIRVASSLSEAFSLSPSTGDDSSLMGFESVIKKCLTPVGEKLVETSVAAEFLFHITSYNVKMSIGGDGGLHIKWSCSGIPGQGVEEALNASMMGFEAAIWRGRDTMTSRKETLFERRGGSDPAPLPEAAIAAFRELAAAERVSLDEFLNALPFRFELPPSSPSASKDGNAASSAEENQVAPQPLPPSSAAKVFAANNNDAKLNNKANEDDNPNANNDDDGDDDDDVLGLKELRQTQPGYVEMLEKQARERGMSIQAVYKELVDSFNATSAADDERRQKELVEMMKNRRAIQDTEVVTFVNGKKLKGELAATIEEAFQLPESTGFQTVTNWRITPRAHLQVSVSVYDEFAYHMSEHTVTVTIDDLTLTSTSDQFAGSPHSSGGRIMVRRGNGEILCDHEASVFDGPTSSSSFTSFDHEDSGSGQQLPNAAKDALAEVAREEGVTLDCLLKAIPIKLL